MATKLDNRNPYVGPRPFKPEEQSLFFGRNREASELLALVIAHPAVLLYAQSGAGKSSLLNAGLIPALAQEGFEVFPLAQVRGALPQDVDAHAIPNLYVYNTLIGWLAPEDDPKRIVAMSLVEFLGERPHLTDEAGDLRPRAILFDQFEELFVLYPDRWPEREAFFQQLAEALAHDPLLRVVFAIREDYLAQLDPYVRLLPERLRARCRMERLREAAALEAVTRPLEGTGCRFAEGVAESLVHELLLLRVAGVVGPVAEVTGEFVEPVQLQVVCASIWSHLTPDVTEISLEHLRRFGDVDQALAKFYESAIRSASEASGIAETRLREWCERVLITPLGTRSMVLCEPETTGGMANTAVDELDRQHFIRAEERAGARWYELSHDRFIGPIQESNGRLKERQREERAKKLRIVSARSLLVGLLGLIILAGTLLALYFGILSFNSTPPMKGDFNIAVVEFGSLDAQGRVVDSSDARSLADALYRALTTQVISSTQATFRIEIRGPSQTERINGATPSERALAARELADKLNADLIIYGNLESSADITRFFPEFYLSDRKLLGAEELVLAGLYQPRLQIESPADITVNPVARAELRRRLLEPIRALAQFVIGLSFYSAADFDRANKYFKAAADLPGWNDHDGKEVLYYFLGQTATQLGDLSSAQGYYNRALETNPAYARARLGVAEILFQKSHADCTPGHVDAAGLQAAASYYQSALDAPFQTASSDIATVAAFGLGRIYLCLSQAQSADRWADAEREFLKVVADFEGGNQRVRDLAVEAHANLGLIYMPSVGEQNAEVKYRRAADQYRLAIELSRDRERQALFYIWLASIHIRLQECAQANEALDKADGAHASAIRPDPNYEAFRRAVREERTRSPCQEVTPTAKP